MNALVNDHLLNYEEIKAEIKSRDLQIKMHLAKILRLPLFIMQDNF